MCVCVCVCVCVHVCVSEVITSLVHSLSCPNFSTAKPGGLKDWGQVASQVHNDMYVYTLSLT